MRLKQPFLKLPIRFDADAIAAEVRALPTSAWTPHPTGYVGNEAVRLVTPGGRDSDNLEGAMAATESLNRCDYVRQIMAEIGSVWGRSRFMGLAAGREVPTHIDIHYYWRTHLRIHIPVITNPGVLFTCGDETVHMAPGECWVFDSSRWHDVQNRGADQRIHLVLDTVGGGILPDLMKGAESGVAEPRFLRPGKRSGDGLAFEKINSPEVMSPWEMRCHLAFIRDQAGDDPRILGILEQVDCFIAAWAADWARFGTDPKGRAVYSKLIEEVRAQTLALGADRIELPNGITVQLMLEQLILLMALAHPDSPVSEVGKDSRAGDCHASFRSRFDRPVVIVSTPRSGSTLLYETLEQAPGLYSTGDESHWIIENVPGLSPAQRGWSSNRLTEEDATDERAERLAQSFYQLLKDRDGRPADGRVRMLEKTPKNALRVPFLNALWPDSNFIYLYRDVRETLYSMMEAWHSGGFRTYPALPGWPGGSWSMLLVPGWQRLNGLNLAQIVAHQWSITTETLLDDLEKIDPSRVQVIEYGALLASPQTEAQRLANWVGLKWDRPLGQTLPLSKTTVSRPDKDKWRRLESAIQSVLPIVEAAEKRARAFLETHSTRPSAAA